MNNLISELLKFPSSSCNFQINPKLLISRLQCKLIPKLDCRNHKCSSLHLQFQCFSLLFLALLSIFYSESYTSYFTSKCSSIIKSNSLAFDKVSNFVISLTENVFFAGDFSQFSICRY